MKKILVIAAIIISVLVSLKDDTIVIPDSSIRFRVIANSNSLVDQDDKKGLAYNLERYLIKLTEEDKSVGEVKRTLKNNEDNINNYINNYLKDNEINTEYELSIGKNYFPTKYYKGIKYSDGEYDSVVVTLGQGLGNNWWCVMYPPLCLIDEAKGNTEYVSLVKEIINKSNVKKL